jgi:hypothetical protein
LFLVLSTLIGFSSFLLTSPTFAGNPGGSNTGSQDSGSPSGSSPQCTDITQQVDCQP